jgi:hypothetical protein
MCPWDMDAPAPNKFLDFFYLIKAYHKFYNFVLHKGHNSEISKVKLIEIELDLPLVILNNISKFGFDLVE